jgi:alkylhydroperoxidase/carboxymuconolactone decarboxylase family protein YurZ
MSSSSAASCSPRAILDGARVHIRRALLAGATPHEMFQAITVAAIPGGVPVVWQGAPILKSWPSARAGSGAEIRD